MPKLSIDLGRDIIKYGPKNDFPAYLLFLFKNHPMHGAIVKGKSRYLAGTEIYSELETPNVEQFLKKANPFESWHSLSRKIHTDRVLSGGYFIKIVSNALGMPLQYFHVSFAKCRFSSCQKFVRYSEDWSDIFKYPINTFPIWKEGTVGTSVYVYKSYSPNKSKLDETYAEPEYISCTLDIDTDIRVGTFSNSLVRNNFSAGNIVTVYNGETDKLKKKEIAENLKFNYEGEDQAGKTVVIFANKDSKSTEVQSVNTNDQDKQYIEVSKRDQQNILTGHNVSGVLFKIKTEGQLGDRKELVENHQLFLNEYVKPEQKHFLQMLEMFYKLRYNQEVEFEVEQVEPIGLELPLDNQNVVNTLNQKDPNIIFDYLVKTYGIKMPEKLDAAGNVVIESAASVNDHLKGLSAAENADVKRIVRDYQKGASGMSVAMAISRITSYGVSEEEAKKWLGIQSVQQSSQEKSVKFFELFNKYAHEINFEDEVVDVQEVKFSCIKEVVRFEDQIKVSADIRNSVLNQIKGNPDAKEEDIAKSLNLDKETIIAAILALVSAGLIASVTDFKPTEKGLNKNTENTETEIYTEYVYAKRSDVPGDTVIPTTRQFCRDLVSQTKQKALKFKSIIALENEFGENVWDFRGGFYTKPGTNETTPWCRHVWQAVTKIRRTKK